MVHRREPESEGSASVLRGGDWERVVSAVQRLVPEARAVILYGSGGAGQRSSSDYDVLVVVEDGGLVRERVRLNRLLGEATGLKTDLNLATARGLRLRRLIDPYVQHCLATGAVAAGDAADLMAVPPISTVGARDALASARLCIREQYELKGVARRGLLEFAAKHLAALDQSLTRRFNRGEFRRMVQWLLAGTDEEAAARLEAYAAELEDRIRALPPNESDREAVLLVAAGVGGG